VPQNETDGETEGNWWTQWGNFALQMAMNDHPLLTRYCSLDDNAKIVWRYQRGN